SGYCCTAGTSLLLWSSQTDRRPGAAMRGFPKKQLHLPWSGESFSFPHDKNIIVLPEKIKFPNFLTFVSRVGRQSK
ncbi:MAG: hypothetical protein Q4P23_06390, partial [Micrococcaceae bacterium]|nr:hypothetical protein [Micrococcaceae bacterium]